MMKLLSDETGRTVTADGHGTVTPVTESRRFEVMILFTDRPLACLVHRRVAACGGGAGASTVVREIESVDDAVEPPGSGSILCIASADRQPVAAWSRASSTPSALDRALAERAGVIVRCVACGGRHSLAVVDYDDGTQRLRVW